MKRLLISIFILLLTVQLVQACTTPTVYNVYGTPINLFGGKLLIDGDDYPENVTKIAYPLTIRNNNNQGFSLSFIPQSGLALSVDRLDVNLTANEQKQANLMIDITRTRSGDMIVTGRCENGLPSGEGVIYVGIYARDGTPSNSCGNTITSCGTYPNCIDVRQLDGCYDGYYRKYACSNNQPIFSSTCTYYCCSKIYGSKAKCVSGMCTGPSGQTYTLQLNISNENTPKTAVVTLYHPGTSTTISSKTITGLGSITSTNSTVDMKIEYDNSKMSALVKSLSLTGLSGQQSIIIDNVNPSASNINIYRAYRVELPSSFSYTGVTLKMKFNDLPYNSQSTLSIYKCADYNTASNTCNTDWVKLGTSFIGDYAKVDLTSFSVYMLGEPKITTTTTTTTSGGGGGGSTSGTSGSSTGGTSGGSTRTSGGSTGESTSSVQPTGFYDFPTNIEIEQGSSKSISGRFLSKFVTGLKNVQFTIVGIDSNWYSINPKSVDSIDYKESVDIRVLFKIPEDARATSYPIELQATSSSTTVRYSYNMNLVVIEKPVLETTTTTIQEEKEETSPLTGMFAAVGAIISGNWYIIILGVIVLGGLVLIVRYYPMISSKGSVYKVSHEEEPKEDYLEIKVKEPEKKVEVKPIKQDDRLELARKKVIEEIRTRALLEDKKKLR